MQSKLSDMAEIWVFLIFCIFCGNMTTSLILGEITAYSLFIGTCIFGIVIRFIIPLAPAFIFRKLVKRRYEYNHKSLLIASLILYITYAAVIIIIFNDKPARTFRLGVPDIWAIYLWTRIINFGKKKRASVENNDEIYKILDNDITSTILSTLQISASKTNPYRYLDHGDDIECQELLDGQWKTTGFYTKSTQAIRPVEITKDTMILLSNLYWYFRKIEQK